MKGSDTIKLINNCSLDELKAILERDISYEIIEIVYDYYHRNKAYTISAFVKRKNISVATLYRYIRKVNKLYNERHS